MQCAGPNEACGNKFRKRELENIRQFLSDVPQLVGFSGTPYRFEKDSEITSVEGSGGGSSQSGSGREIDRYNTMFGFPSVGHYLLVGLYTPTRDMAVMHLKINPVKFSDIRLSGEFTLNQLRRQQIETATLANQELNDVYVQAMKPTKTGGATLYFSTPGAEHVLEWLQKNSDVEPWILHPTLFWAPYSTMANRRKLNFRDFQAVADKPFTQQSLESNSKRPYHQLV